MLEIQNFSTLFYFQQFLYFFILIPFIICILKTTISLDDLTFANDRPTSPSHPRQVSLPFVFMRMSTLKVRSNFKFE